MKNEYNVTIFVNQRHTIGECSALTHPTYVKAVFLVYILTLMIIALVTHCRHHTLQIVLSVLVGMLVNYSCDAWHMFSAADWLGSVALRSRRYSLCFDFQVRAVTPNEFSPKQPVIVVG